LVAETQIASRYAAIAVAYRSSDRQTSMGVIALADTGISNSYLCGVRHTPISRSTDRTARKRELDGEIR
jgi:hypothetical protein